MSLTRVLLLCMLALVIVSASAQQTGTISGVVRGVDGKPVAGATVTLTVQHQPLPIAKKITGSAGGYKFEEIAKGDYVVSAEFSGYARTTLARASDGTATTADLVLARQSVNSAEAAPSRPKLQLQASGLHGLIDPGGYSASASADAASGLVRGMADMKRTNFGAAIHNALPCSAQAALQKNLLDHPDQLEAYLRVGEFYVAHEEPSQATPFLEHALELDRNDYEASRDLAITHMERGDFAEARRLLTALAAAHNQPEVHQLLARADEGSGAFEEAAQQYRIADSQQPSEQSLLGVGYELILAGLPKDALAVFLAGEAKYTRSIALKIGEGAAQFLLGHATDSVDNFLEAGDIDPADPRPYPFLSAASGASNAEEDRVHQAFQRYLERMPDRADANYYAAVDSFRHTSTSDVSVESLLKHAIQLDPAMASAHLLLADMYARRKDDAAAIPEYEAAVRMAPEKNEAHYRLALACRRAGKVEEAAREMKIFERAKAQQASTAGDSGTDMAQFISVMKQPEQPETGGTRCGPGDR